MASAGAVMQIPVVGRGLVFRMKADSMLLAKLVEGPGVDIGVGSWRVPTDFVVVTAKKASMQFVATTKTSCEIAEAISRSKSRHPHATVSVQGSMGLKQIQKRVHESSTYRPVLINVGTIVEGNVAGSRIYALVLKQDGSSLICVHLVKTKRDPLWRDLGIVEHNVVGMLVSTATQVAYTEETASMAREILYMNGESKKDAMPECANCADERTDLRLCARCNLVAYCGKACQKQHWKRAHKSVCVPLGGRGRTPLPPPPSDACPICCDSLEDATAMRCGHRVHADCLIKNFQVAGDSRCPLCRN